MFLVATELNLWIHDTAREATHWRRKSEETPRILSRLLSGLSHSGRGVFIKTRKVNSPCPNNAAGQ